VTDDPDASGPGVSSEGTPPGLPRRAAASSYSTGGGGVTFERRVGATYLALLLTGERAAELGDARMVTSVAFQQAPAVPVDDVVIHAARRDETAPSLELAVGIRRAPNLVRSDNDTRGLIAQYVRADLKTRSNGREQRLALVVAGPQPHATQLAKLAALAAVQMDAPSFFNLVDTPGKVERVVTDRLRHVVDLVADALQSLGVADSDDMVVRQRTWALLARLSVLMPRVEEPDMSDWVATQNRLVRVARGNDLIGAGHLLDRLESLAARFGPSAATVDLALIRRETHSLLDLETSRHQAGWAALNHLQAGARAAVRDSIGLADPATAFHLDRTGEGAALVAAATRVPATLVRGESGTGKSALVLGAAAATNPDEVQTVCLNLRQLPETSLALVTTLGCPLEALLSELSAPHRLLVIDGADSAAETRHDMLVYLVRAARDSGVSVVAIAATETRQQIHDLLAEHLGEVADRPIPGLSDDELARIAARFPKLQQLVANGRSRELIRRLVVIDLLEEARILSSECFAVLLILVPVLFPEHSFVLTPHRPARPHAPRPAGT
jgi:hypothetical protein